MVLLGPVKMKLIKRTRTSFKSKLRFRRSQKEDDSVTCVKRTERTSLKITYRSTTVSRMAGTKRGHWKRNVVGLLRNQ